MEAIAMSAIADGSLQGGFAVLTLVGVTVVLGFSSLWASKARSADDDVVVEARQGVVTGGLVAALGLLFHSLL
jgi:hypothetical protein